MSMSTSISYPQFIDFLFMKQECLFEIEEKRFFPEVEEVEVYHDEVYDDNRRPFGHQFLIIPTRSKNFFSKVLTNERKRYNESGEFTINWKELKKNNRGKNFIANSWLKCLYEATRNRPFYYIINKRSINAGVLGIRIGSIFIDSIKDLSDNFWAHIEKDEERSRIKYETLLRMGLQGILHFCFNPEYTNYKKVVVKSFFTDGRVFGKIPLNKNRIIDRLTKRCREYIEIPENIEIVPVLKSKIKTPEVNLEELTDLILGGTYYLYGEKREEWKEEIVSPLWEMYKKRDRNKIGFENSSHFRSFTITRCKIGENNDLIFEDLMIRDFSRRNKFQKNFIF